MRSLASQPSVGAATVPLRLPGSTATAPTDPHGPPYDAAHPAAIRVATTADHAAFSTTAACAAAALATAVLAADAVVTISISVTASIAAATAPIAAAPAPIAAATAPIAAAAVATPAARALFTFRHGRWNTLLSCGRPTGTSEPTCDPQGISAHTSVPTCGPRGISAQRSAREATRHSPPSTSGRGAVRGGPANLGRQPRAARRCALLGARRCVDRRPSTQGGGLTRSFDEDTSTHAVLARFSAALARIDADERDAEVAAVATASASGADSNTTVQQDGANSNTTILQQDVDHVNEQHSAYDGTLSAQRRGGPCKHKNPCGPAHGPAPCSCQTPHIFFPKPHTAVRYRSMSRSTRCAAITDMRSKHRAPDRER